MSRLYDRVMAQGCRPLRFSELYPQDERESYERRVAQGIAELAMEHGSPDAGEEGIERLIGAVRSGEYDAKSREVAQVSSDIPVVSAEEVASYVNGLPPFWLHDLIGAIAPPFPEFFIEVQGIEMRTPIGTGVRAFAGHFRDVESANGADALIDWCEQNSLDPDDVGWVLWCDLIVEWEKNEPVGPVWTFCVPVARDGAWLRRDDEPVWFHGFPDLWSLGDIQELPEGDKELIFDHLSEYVSPLLLTISLMHCKNVDVRPVDQPERLSRKHARKHGRPLTRYYVLDVQPMRRMLDSEGEAQTKGLPHAMHICRGHFKTYTEDAPLFGKHTGIYWWDSQARGKAEHGVVEKDYRIRLDQGLGREYVEADEHPEIRPTAPEHTGIDPDLGGRGLRAHNVTQNLLARVVTTAGFEPRRPKPDEPQYDLAWEAGDVIWVAEVKSISSRNERRQLHLGLGQVIDYRHLLAAEGRTVNALIATERQPSDPSWRELLAKEAVALVWPGRMEIAMRS